VNPADILAFAADLPDKLFEYMLVSYVEGYYPTAFNVLALIGIIDLVHVGGTPGDQTKPAFVRKRLALNRIGDLFTNPEALFRSLYGWGDPGFDGRVILERLNQLLYALVHPVRTAIYDLLVRSPKTDISPPDWNWFFQER
jgi:hypothetical protein